MMAHPLPPQGTAKPMSRWGSVEIAMMFLDRARALRAPGINANRLIVEITATMPAPAATDQTDWIGTAPRNHRRDAGMSGRLPAIASVTLEPNQRRILRLLATLDTRPQPAGPPLQMCANRRRLRASAEAMQTLHRARLVNGAGSRDPWGTGNTPDSSWWWLSSAGLELARQLAPS